MRITGGYPQPVELTTDLGLACGQLLLAVMLAPALFDSRDRTIRAAAVGIVMTAMASKLAGRSVEATIEVTAVVALWITVFALLARSRPVMLALLFVTLAGPVLFYASLEYGSQPPALGDLPTLFIPTLGICTTRLHGHPWRAASVPTLIVLATFVKAWRAHNAPSAAT